MGLLSQQRDGNVSPALARSPPAWQVPALGLRSPSGPHLGLPSPLEPRTGVFPVCQARCSPALHTERCKSCSGPGETDVLWLWV